MLLKDIYSKEFLESLATAVIDVYPEFNQTKFVDDCLAADWEELKLMERSDRIVENLRRQFPDNFKKSAQILKKIGPKFTGLAATCLPNYVAKFGLADWKESMETLNLLTRYSSAEFAIRPFLVRYPQKTEQLLLQWSTDSDVDVRRLASEGIRPRLPWGIRLTAYTKNPEPIMPILDNLIFDESEYVQKSVANNLNDISKDNPQVVIEFVQKYWHQKESSDWVINRGVRTLFKAGQPEILKLLGYDSQAVNKLKDISFTPEKQIANAGETTSSNYRFTSDSSRPIPLYLGYRVHYIRQNKTDSYKDFFIKRINLKPNVTINGNLKIKWKQLTTRKLYSGKHLIELLVNTQVVAKAIVDFRAK